MPNIFSYFFTFNGMLKNSHGVWPLKVWPLQRHSWIPQLRDWTFPLARSLSFWRLRLSQSDFMLFSTFFWSLEFKKLGDFVCIFKQFVRLYLSFWNLGSSPVAAFSISFSMRFCYFFCFFPVGNPWLTRSTWSQKKVNLDYHSTLHHWVTTQEMSQMSLPVWFLDVFLTNSTPDIRTLFAASVHYPSCKESRRFGKAEVSWGRWCQNVSKFPKYWLRCITQPCRSLVLPGSTASVQPSRAFQSLPILRRLVWFQHVVNTVANFLHSDARL